MKTVLTRNMHLLAEIQLFPDGTLFIHIALILLMIFILNRTLYRPINRVLEGRTKNKGNYFVEAEELMKKVEEKESRYASELLDARSAGYELIEKEQKEAVAVREKKLADIKDAVADRLASGKAEIDEQASTARAAIETEADTLADHITTSILK